MTPKHTLLPLLLALGCAPRDHPLFKLLPPSQTGVTFANTITPDDTENLQSDYFIYNGGGVAVGDINNDGLQDILLTGNMVPSKLYLNKGGMQFADVTGSSGVKPDCWATGATMADVNNDGWLDIYISCTGPERTPAARRANRLYINNGNGTFTEAAARFGVADTGFTIQSVFLDYNKDGNLDLLVMNNSPHEFARGESEIHPAGIASKASGSYDQLYRNNGDGTFTNVSRQAGMLEKIGYGLGVVVCDVNGDGWPDIYLSNDDAPNDVLYVNNRDGTFTDKAGVYLKHASFAGMGLDVADVNNDGWPDIMQTDMMPADLSDRKRMSGAMNTGGLVQLRNRGFRDDYQINTLQLSNGVTPAGDLVFSEIAHLAGVAYTNWSWSALFADFDDDGQKDLFITNGYPKAGNDYDYQMGMYRLKHGGLDPRVGHERGVELLRQLRGYHLPNYMFRNNGDLTFTDETKAWGMDQPGFSYGAAYVDLDNDGKLDVVVNNIDDAAFIYRNVAPRDSAHHYLAVQLQGDGPNRNGIGATLILSAGGQRQYIYHSPYRGYMSTMDDRAHFGLGRANRVDSLQVIWPDGRYQLLTDIAADQMVRVKQADAKSRVIGGLWPVASCDKPCHWPPTTGHQLFQPMDSRRAPKYLHHVSSLIDYDVQPLLPYMPSRQGPPLAVADVNGDGLSDLYIGGADGVPGKLFVQQKDGSFVESVRGQPWAADTAFDDWGAQFFDANGDGKPDLFVASCGYRLSPVSRQLQSRLYVNAGNGRFVRDTLALPTMQTCTSAVAAGDFTGDGKPDLFVGGRLTPRNYPAPTRSYLLRNEGGRFVDVTAQWAPALADSGGMITAAVWVDFDGDGKLDLVTAGEWMPIEFWHNDGTWLRNVTASMGLPPTRGWWYSLAVADVNRDGHPDLVAGNLGLNATYVTSPQDHFGVYAGDFSAPRSGDIVLTVEQGGTEYPLFGLARYGPVIYQLALRFPTYAEFSHAPVGELFGPGLAKAIHYQTDTFASLYLQNTGNGTFTVAALPNLAQIAPIRGIIPTDVDGDGNLDLIVAGNLWDMEPNTPRLDAGNGLWLKGDGQGHFTAVPPVASGFLAPGHVTGLALVKTHAGNAVVVANNGDSLQVFTIVKR